MQKFKHVKTGLSVKTFQLSFLRLHFHAFFRHQPVYLSVFTQQKCKIVQTQQIILKEDQKYNENANM